MDNWVEDNSGSPAAGRPVQFEWARSPMTITVALIVSVIALMILAGLILPRDRRPPVPPENGATRLADPSPSAGPGPSRE